MTYRHNVKDCTRKLSLHVHH